MIFHCRGVADYRLDERARLALHIGRPVEAALAVLPAPCHGFYCAGIIHDYQRTLRVFAALRIAFGGRNKALRKPVHFRIYGNI